MYTLNNIWSVLTKQQKFQSSILVLLMVINVLLELVGIGMIIPIISILTDQDFLNNISYFSLVTNYFGEINDINLLLFSVLIVVAVFTLKSIYSVFFIWWQQFFSMNILIDVSSRLFTNYLNQPYLYYLNVNSSYLINVINREVSIFHGAIMQSITFTTEIVLIIGICSFLIYIEPIATIGTILTILVFVAIFILSVSKPINKWGEQRVAHSERLTKHVIQGINGIKDIKILNREKMFLDEYVYENYKYSRVNRLNNTLQQIPRIYLEFIAVLSFMVLVLILAFQGNSISNILPVLMLIGFSTLRILPSFNRLTNSYQAVIFAKKSIRLVRNEIKKTKYLEIKHSNNKNSTDLDNITEKVRPTIILNNISFTYPDTKKYSINEINFKIKFGEFIGITGKSGAGKSTLMDLILGLIEPQVGEITLLNEANNSELDITHSNLIGYVPQSIYLIDDTIKNNIAFGIPENEINEAKLDEAIKVCQLSELINELQDGVNTLVGERGIRLSGGQRHRIGIARAMYNSPQILVLDESTSALDNETEKEMMRAINSFKH